MKAGTTYDLELGKRLHDAYDAMGPDTASQERVLHALKARERSTNAGGLSAASTSVRRMPWLVVLPLAACLALALVVIRAALPTSESAGQKTDELVFETSYDASQADGESGAENLTSATNAVEGAAETEADEAQDASVYDTASAYAEAYPLVTTASGEALRVGEVYTGAVDEEAAMPATATSEVTGESIACEVVQLDGTYVVRYLNDDTWYVASKV